MKTRLPYFLAPLLTLVLAVVIQFSFVHAREPAPPAGQDPETCMQSAALDFAQCMRDANNAMDPAAAKEQCRCIFRYERDVCLGKIPSKCFLD
jgi:hypothetical protein